MKRALWVGVLSLSTLLAVPAVGRAVTIVPAAVSFTVDGGARTDVTPSQRDGGFAVGGDEGPLRFGGEAQGWEITLTGFLDPDPSIGYGISVTDFGAPSSFAFLFATPIVPVGVPNIVTASLVGGLTDFTGNGVSITPLLPDTDGDGQSEIQVTTVGAPSTNMGVDVGLGFASGPGTSGSFYAYGPYAVGPQFGPGPGPWTLLTVSTSFRLSGDRDIAALTGFASIEPIPEPATLALLGSGLVALAVGRRTRHTP